MEQKPQGQFERPPNGRVREFSESALSGIVQISSSFSMPTFLTFGFQIMPGIHLGALAGFATCLRSPVEDVHFLCSPLTESYIGEAAIGRL